MSIGSGVVAVADSAVVSLTGGTSTPAGSVAFSLCKVDSPGLCTTGGTSVGSTNLSGTAYPVTVVSPTAYVTSAGRYCWRATWTCDSANGIPGSSDSSATECFTVNPVTPSLSTSAWDDVLLGTAVTDTATLSGLATKPASPIINLTGTGGAAAGGTITFTLYGPGNCSTVAYTSSATAINSSGVANASFTPTATGTYHWVATYSGDSPNNNGTSHNTTCNDTNEDVVVSSVPSSMSTAQTWIPRDSATVSATAGGTMTGTVSFALYASNDCAVGGDSPIYSTSRTVNGASPVTVRTQDASSQPAAQSATGDYSWSVSYDSTNAAQDDIAATCHETSSLTIDNDTTTP